MEKRVTSGLEMVRDTAPDENFQDKSDGHPADDGVSRALTALRCSQDVTQAELAKRAGCTQSKISRIENSPNDRLKLEDLTIYARAFNMRVSIDFGHSSTVADAIGGLARQIRNGLGEVADRVRHEETTDEGTKKPYEAFLFDMLDLFMDNLEGLRARQNGSRDSGETTRAGNGRPMDTIGRSETFNPERRKNGSTGIRIHTPIDIGEGNGRTESPSRQ